MNQVALFAAWLVPSLRKCVTEYVACEERLLRVRAVSGLSESELKPLVRAVKGYGKRNPNPNPPTRSAILADVAEFLARGGTLGEAVAALDVDRRCSK